MRYNLDEGGFAMIKLYIFFFLCSHIHTCKGSVCLDYFIVWKIIRKVGSLAFIALLVSYIVQNRFHHYILMYVLKYFECVSCPHC